MIIKARPWIWFVPLASIAAAGVMATALASEHLVSPAIIMHASLMIAAWGVLLPAGGILARYFKVTKDQAFPKELDNQFWFNWHRRLQYAGLAVASVAFLVILHATGGHIDTWHGRLGVATFALGWAQWASTLLRGNKGGPTDKKADPARPETWRGDHFDMTRRRRRFESYHKTCGWLALLLAAMTIFLGVTMASANGLALFITTCLIFGAVVAVLDGIFKKRWTDTYMAIWGTPYAETPGLITDLFEASHAVPVLPSPDGRHANGGTIGLSND